jgi:hypothetical protein
MQHRMKLEDKEQSVKGKSKAVPLHAMEVHGGERRYSS